MTGVAQSGPQLVADRYSYLACLGWPLLLAGGFFRWWPEREAGSIGQRQFVAAAVFLVVVGLGFLTWQQTAVWRSPISLWQHGTKAEPLSSIAHYNLGRAFERENNPTQAIDSYRRAVAVNSGYSKAHFNLARLLALKGLEAEAMAHYRRVIEIRPDHADAHNDLGLLLDLKGEDAAALAGVSQSDPSSNPIIIRRCSTWLSCWLNKAICRAPRRTMSRPRASIQTNRRSRFVWQLSWRGKVSWSWRPVISAAR